MRLWPTCGNARTAIGPRPAATRAAETSVSAAAREPASSSAPISAVIGASTSGQDRERVVREHRAHAGLQARAAGWRARPVPHVSRQPSLAPRVAGPCPTSKDQSRPGRRETPASRRGPRAARRARAGTPRRPSRSPAPGPPSPRRRAAGRHSGVQGRPPPRPPRSPRSRGRRARPGPRLRQAARSPSATATASPASAGRPYSMAGSSVGASDNPCPRRSIATVRAAPRRRRATGVQIQAVCDSPWMSRTPAVGPAGPPQSRKWMRSPSSTRTTNPSGSAAGSAAGTDPRGNSIVARIRAPWSSAAVDPGPPARPGSPVTVMIATGRSSNSSNGPWPASRCRSPRPWTRWRS